MTYATDSWAAAEWAADGADLLAPSLTLPTATATSATTATGTVTTNDDTGTLYRLASVNATESVATVKAAALSQAVSALGLQSVTFAGLIAATAYYAHYVHTDLSGNDSAVADSAIFMTYDATPGYVSASAGSSRIATR